MMVLRLLLRFDSTSVKEPVLSTATLKTGALINILRAYVGARRGEILIDVSDDKVEEVKKVFDEFGVEVTELIEGIIKDEERCTHCGVCVSICPTRAISFNVEKKVVIDTEKCIHCGACIKVCPTNALSLPI
ncbi:[Fe-S]-binding protein [Archaeoglobales archaeon]|nr:MAG: [Fe-S]-binding protein [Archaeoglobales archaeon]HDN73415.1 4Fe-4S dicluster domain-containing protein [Archaeoglobus sp.]